MRSTSVRSSPGATAPSSAELIWALPHVTSDLSRQTGRYPCRRLYGNGAWCAFLPHTVCWRFATVNPLRCGHRGGGLTLVARVPRTSSQQGGAREPGTQVARAGARAHRRLRGAHGQDVWRPSTPRRGDPAKLVRLAGETRDRLAADGARRDARPGP